MYYHSKSVISFNTASCKRQKMLHFILSWCIIIMTGSQEETTKKHDMSKYPYSPPIPPINNFAGVTMASNICYYVWVQSRSLLSRHAKLCTIHWKNCNKGQNICDIHALRSLSIVASASVGVNMSPLPDQAEHTNRSAYTGTEKKRRVDITSINSFVIIHLQYRNSLMYRSVACDVDMHMITVRQWWNARGSTRVQASSCCGNGRKWSSITGSSCP